MTVVFSAILLAISGLQTKNSADCMGLPSDQQLACIREIRAGRSFDVQYPADPFPKAAAPQADTQEQASQPQPQPTQQLQPPAQPALVSDLYQRQLVFAAERQAIASERTAKATEKIATIETIRFSIGVVCILVSAIFLLPSR